MKEIFVKDGALRQAASEGMDAFIGVFVKAIDDAIGGELTAETMSELSTDQVALLAWNILHEEVMDGGFIQLIHNGYGGFIFRNPFAKIMNLWGIEGLGPLINKARKLYFLYEDELTEDCTDEEFMSLFERYPQFDDLDDSFVEHEEDWMEQVAQYIDDHIESFAKIA